MARWSDLAARAPDVAIMDAGRLPDAHDRKSAGTEVCLVLGENDPASALKAAWALGLALNPDSEREGAALRDLAERWAAADLDGSLAWAATLPPDRHGRRDLVATGLACAVADEAPAAAARLILDFVSADTGAQFDASAEVLRRLASRAPAEALRWPSHLPAGPLRRSARSILATLPPNAAPKPRPASPAP